MHTNYRVRAFLGFYLRSVGFVRELLLMIIILLPITALPLATIIVIIWLNTVASNRGSHVGKTTLSSLFIFIVVVNQGNKLGMLCTRSLELEVKRSNATRALLTVFIVIVVKLHHLLLLNCCIITILSLGNLGSQPKVGDFLNTVVLSGITVKEKHTVIRLLSLQHVISWLDNHMTH